MMNLRRLTQSVLRQNYYLTHSYHRLRLWVEDLHRSNEKIVIYQMGKVGSTSIWESLEALDLDIPVYHIHTLNHQNIKKAVEKDKNSFPKLRFIYAETVQSEYLRWYLDQQSIQSPWHVITLVRDPMAKILSYFFQRLEKELLLGKDYRSKIDKEGYQRVLEEIIERFYKECVYNPDHEHPFSWFNRELRDNLNVDVFNNANLSGKDYHIFKADRANVLLLKLESLSHCYRTAFQEFLGLQNFNLIRSNTGTQKRYGKLYKDFLEAINLPDTYIDRIYDFDLVKHFYSDLELERFYQHWKKPGGT